jgi:hypothetical protein
MGRCRKWQINPAKIYKYTSLSLLKAHKINEWIRKLGSMGASRCKLSVLGLICKVLCDLYVLLNCSGFQFPQQSNDSKCYVSWLLLSCKKQINQRKYFENARLHTEWKIIVNGSVTYLTGELFWDRKIGGSIKKSISDSNIDIPQGKKATSFDHLLQFFLFIVMDNDLRVQDLQHSDNATHGQNSSQRNGICPCPRGLLSCECCSGSWK